jgi:hypothetical protein
MNRKKFYSMAASVVVAMLMSVSLSSAQINKEASEQLIIGASQPVLGSWYITVTSDTFPVPFRTMVTFSEGGGVVASAQGDILLAPPPGVPPVATAAHGAWSRTSNREFLFTFRQIFYEADGSYAGGAKVRNAATLDASGNGITGQLVVDYYDASDQIVFTGTGHFTGSRIVVEALP